MKTRWVALGDGFAGGLYRANETKRRRRNGRKEGEEGAEGGEREGREPILLTWN